MTNIEFICNLCSINTGYHMPIVSALGRLRQEDGKFKKKKSGCQAGLMILHGSSRIFHGSVDNVRFIYFGVLEIKHRMLSLLAKCSAT
jgi:hypothetical protein